MLKSKDKRTVSMRRPHRNHATIHHCDLGKAVAHYSSYKLYIGHRFNICLSWNYFKARFCYLALNYDKVSNPFYNK